MGQFFPWAATIPLPEGGTLADHPVFPQYYKDPSKETRVFTGPWPGGQSRTAVKEFVYYSSPNSRGGFGNSGPAHKKSFARVMTKIIDANGNTTTYALDSTTGQRVSEEVRDAQNTLLKFAEYQMHAFVTEETLALGGGTGLVQHTVYTPDRDSGKVATKTVYRPPSLQLLADFLADATPRFLNRELPPPGDRSPSLPTRAPRPPAHRH